MKYNPPPNATDPNQGYTNGQAGTMQGSPVNAMAIEYPQREIVAVIEAAGLTPDNADLTQLRQALEKLIPDPEFVPAGTRMLFQQSAAPTGWTKEESVSYDDAALRIVTGNVGTANSLGFSTVFASKSYNVTGTTGATTLSVAQLAGHNHQTMNLQYNQPWGNAGYQKAGFIGTHYPQSNYETSNTSSAGSSTSHTHPMTSGSTTINLAVKRADVIICIKS